MIIINILCNNLFIFKFKIHDIMEWENRNSIEQFMD